jgi:F0F1-type ATP synthase delta subunit
MAESVTIARPYAEALFRVAKESGNLGQVVRERYPARTVGCQS